MMFLLSVCVVLIIGWSLRNKEKLLATPLGRGEKSILSYSYLHLFIVPAALLILPFFIGFSTADSDLDYIREAGQGAQAAFAPFGFIAVLYTAVAAIGFKEAAKLPKNRHKSGWRNYWMHFNAKSSLVIPIVLLLYTLAIGGVRAVVILMVAGALSYILPGIPKQKKPIAEKATKSEAHK